LQGRSARQAAARRKSRDELLAACYELKLMRRCWKDRRFQNACKKMDEFSVWRGEGMTKAHQVRGLTIKYGTNAALVHRASPQSRMAAAGRGAWLARWKRVPVLAAQTTHFQAAQRLVIEALPHVAPPSYIHKGLPSWKDTESGMGLTLRLLDRYMVATGGYTSVYEYYRPKCLFGKLGLTHAQMLMCVIACEAMEEM